MRIGMMIQGTLSRDKTFHDAVLLSLLIGAIIGPLYRRSIDESSRARSRLQALSLDAKETTIYCCTSKCVAYTYQGRYDTRTLRV